MVWQNSAHKINKMQSICYCASWQTQNRTAATWTSWFELKSNPNQGRSIGERRKGNVFPPHLEQHEFSLGWPSSLLLLFCCVAGLAALSPSFGRLWQGREGRRRPRVGRGQHWGGGTAQRRRTIGLSRGCAGTMTGRENLLRYRSLINPSPSNGKK
jgi:hypothetical protein